MEHSSLNLKLIIFSSFCLLGQLSFAQSDYEKRQKANKENDEHLKRVYENNLPNQKASSVNTTVPKATSSGSSIYVTDHQRKMDYYNNKEKAVLDAWEEKERKFKILSADVPKTEANYYKLISLAEQAGFDYYSAMRMNGRYAPKIISLPVLVPFQQEKFDSYKKMAEDYSATKNWNAALNALQEAVNISDDPNLRLKIADIYKYYLRDYDGAAKQYYFIQQSAITNKPDMKNVYRYWGEVSIYGGNYSNAIRCFTDLPSMYSNTFGTSIFLSYAYYLAGNLKEARANLLNNYEYEFRNDESNLIKNYYLIQQGNSDAATTLLAKNKEKNTDIAYTGDLKNDLSLILLKNAKSNLKFANLSVCYFLDLAAELNPTNIEIAETRYDYNTTIKRVGFDIGMSPEVLSTLASGKPARVTKREEDEITAEKLRSKGYMILWFGNGDKPLTYASAKVNIAGGVSEKTAVDYLLKQDKEKAVKNRYAFIGYTFLKDATEDKASSEIVKKLKIKLKNIKEDKYGYTFSSSVYKFEK